jgi:addiction module HigA family antidote
MTAIKCEDLEAGGIDLSDVVDPTAAPLPPINPGQVLRAELLEPLGLSAGAVARAIGVPRNRLSGIINGSRTITADAALRLGIGSRMPKPWNWCVLALIASWAHEEP